MTGRSGKPDPRPRRWEPTRGPWQVAEGLTGDLARHNGLTVLTADGRPVAHCANPDLPLGEQRANARAIAAVPDIISALEGAELYIGDRPRSREADEVYSEIAHALGRLRHGVRP